MTTDIEKSFKAKIRNIAKETKRNPADLWQSIVLERFLVRLAQSAYRHHFILKGGVLLAKYVPIGRETRDLDLLGIAIPNDKEQLKQTFTAIASINLNDSFVFSDIDFSVLEHAHMAYGGVEISMTAYFGRTRFPVMIDIGFGDTVRSIDKQIPLTYSSKGPLFEEKVNLLCYPPEFIFAEKLETVVFRGNVNSRMKDYHDLYTMSVLSNLSLEDLKAILPMVFQHRQTPLAIPLAFLDTEISMLQNHWAPYRSRLHPESSQNLPLSIADCIDRLNNRLKLLTAL